MSLEKTLLLGFIAGVTIFIGLPVGRLRHPAASLRLLLNATAVGVLLFLLWDVLSHAWAPIDIALGDVHAGHHGMDRVLGYGSLFAGGLVVGMLSLIGYERYMGRASNTATRKWSAAQHTSLLIAVGIGLHNFAEGLAIGQSAASNDVALATVLVIGFGLHNATEGFGIVAPLAADLYLDHDGTHHVPSWGFLLLMGGIGGGPTFVGAAVGHGFTSEAVSVVFLTLAAGSILYVVTQLLGMAARARRSDLLGYGLLIGLIAGFITDGIVTAGGA